MVLTAEADVAVRRFRGRRPSPVDPLPGVIAAFVEAAGGELHLRQLHGELTELLAARPWIRVLPSVPGDERATYHGVVAAIASHEGSRPLAR